MRPRRVKTAPGFERALRELPRILQEQTIEKSRPSRLSGSLSTALRNGLFVRSGKRGLAGIWAFRVTSGVRVFYTQQKDSEGSYSELFHVGPHDDYRTVTRRR